MGAFGGGPPRIKGGLAQGASKKQQPQNIRQIIGGNASKTVTAAESLPFPGDGDMLKPSTGGATGAAMITEEMIDHAVQGVLQKPKQVFSPKQ